MHENIVFQKKTGTLRVSAEITHTTQMSVLVGLRDQTNQDFIQLGQQC